MILPILLGCGIADRVQRAVSNEPAANSTAANVNANKTLTDKAVDTAVGGQQVGIPECDAALDKFARLMDNPEDNFVVRMGKKAAESAFREQIKQKLEEQQANKQDVARFCKEFGDSLTEDWSEGNANTSR